MKNTVQYKKELKIEICYRGVIITQLVTCNFPNAQSLTSLITQIQWVYIVKAFLINVWFNRWISNFLQNKMKRRFIGKLLKVANMEVYAHKIIQFLVDEKNRSPLSRTVFAKTVSNSDLNRKK